MHARDRRSWLALEIALEQNVLAVQEAEIIGVCVGPVF